MRRIAITTVTTATLAAALAVTSHGGAERATRMPGPAGPGGEQRAGLGPPSARAAREADEAACRKCHAGVAAEHDGSLHARSFTDASFQRGYTMEPAGFCRSCHAPEASPEAEPDAFARSHGVACVTCHRPDPGGPVLASPEGKGRERPGADAAPHAIARVDAFGTRACVACHEFAFPGAAGRGEKGLMQKTATEHAASASRAQTCASCHMPRGERGRSGHVFAASRSPATLARALDVTASRDAAGRAVFVLTARDVGHAYPTGDLFRRLLLRVKTARGTIEQPLERTFRAAREPDGTTVRFEATDTRLAPSRRVEIPLAGAAGAAGDASWQVLYQRLTGVAQTPPFGVMIEDEVVVAHGAL